MGMKTIESIGDLNYGAVNEQFARAFEEVVRNIQDPATEANQKREILITVSIAPTKDRGMAATNVSVKTKLAPVKADSGSVMFDFDKQGRIVARTQEAENQGELFLDDKREAVGDGR